MIHIDFPRKQIMNSTRVNLLHLIASRKWESTIMYLVNKSGKTEKVVQRAVERFAEFKLIRYTGGGEFEITEKGLSYLNSLAKEAV
ncbi:hypothetical protein ACFVS2_25535 [Brevibacillus sp. NPDC058079]|uniref:hypothetical protein n=1 Tax=Brevibacillus sp. NPDC058079 TaxID=3346330 RepID=UPI0036E957C3